MHRILTGVAGVMALGSLALGCQQASARDPIEVTLGWPGSVGVNYADFVAATELGFYEQEGLKLKIVTLQGSAVVVPQVATKSIEIGGSTADPLLIQNLSGKGSIPVKFFYNRTREYNFELVVPADSPVKSVADLKGKTLGVNALTSASLTVARLVLADSGLVADKDYKVIAVGDGAAAYKALFDGQIDTYNAVISTNATFEAQGGGKLRRLALPDRYKSLFQTAFLAHEDTIRDKPEILVGFARATTKAAILCNIATEWCIRNFWKYNPNLRPANASDDQSVRTLAESLRIGWKPYFSFPAGSPRRFGEFPAGSWDNYVDVLHRGGVVPTNKAETAAFYTNELVAKINDFDVAAIEKQAAGLK